MNVKAVMYSSKALLPVTYSSPSKGFKHELISGLQGKLVGMFFNRSRALTGYTYRYNHVQIHVCDVVIDSG